MIRKGERWERNETEKKEDEMCHSVKLPGMLEKPSPHSCCLPAARTQPAPERPETPAADLS